MTCCQQHNERPVAKGALVFYINVGSLSQHAADAFVDRVKDQWRDYYVAPRVNNPKVPEDVAVFFIPVRDQPTLVDFVPFAVTEEELLDAIEEDEAIDGGEEFLHELHLTDPHVPHTCCHKSRCCKETAPAAAGVVGTLKGWCRRVFGSNCCKQ